MSNPGITTAGTFEAYARRYFSDLWETELAPARVHLGGMLVKSFDLVSANGRIIGDAKWYKSLKVPAAKWATIAEYVWLLQHTEAERRFLAFGQSAEVAERWLKRFGALIDPVEFYFLDESGHRRL